MMACLADMPVLTTARTARDVTTARRAFAHVAGMGALHGFGMFVCSDRGGGGPPGSAGPWCPVDRPRRAIGWQTAVSHLHPENAWSIGLAERRDAAAPLPDPDAPTVIYRHAVPEGAA